MRLKNKIAKPFLIFLSFLLLVFLPAKADYAINVFTGQMDYYETGLPAGGAAGGITYFDGTDWQNLAVGANGLVLTVAAGTPTWAAAGAPGAHAASHAGGAADPVNHNTLANYVAAEHLDWTADQGASNIHDNNILASSVTQHVASIDHNLLLNYVAGEHLVLPSTIAAVLTDHNLAAHTAIGIVDLQNVFYISPVGGDYATIQAALTAENAGGEVFLVGPGTYAADTINFSANNQTVRGVGLTPDAHVTQVDAVVCNFGAHTGCRLENLHLEMTVPTTAKDLIAGTGDLKIRWCHLEVTNANVITADQPTCIDTTGDVIMTFGTVEYANTGNDGGGGTAIKAAVRIGVGANVLFRRVSFEITGAGQSLAITPIYGTAGTAVIHRCSIDVDDDVSTNTIGFTYSNIVGGTHEMFNNWIHVDNANNTAHGIFLLSTETVRSMHNHIHVTSAGGTAVSATTAAGTTWISQFDDIIAANGDAAGGTLTMVSSETDGNLTISGLTASKPMFTNASNVVVSTGTMPVNQGGTNMTSYTVGDILYASAAGILSGLADVAVNQVLVSGGVGVAPAYSATPTLTSVTVDSLFGPAAALDVNTNVIQDVNFWDTIASGNPSINIYGWNTAGGDRESAELTMDDTNDEFLIQVPNSTNNEGISIVLQEVNQKLRLRQSADTIEFSHDGTDGLILSSSASLLLESTGGAPEVEITGELIPAADNTYDIGKVGTEWKDAFFDGTVTMAGLAGGAIGSDIQEWNANLDTYAGITPSANVQTLLANATFALFLADLSATAGAAFD